MAAQVHQVGLLRRVLFSSILYTAVVGSLGAFIGWALLEPLFQDSTVISGTVKETFPHRSLAGCAPCKKGVSLDVDDNGQGTCPTCRNTVTVSKDMPMRG